MARERQCAPGYGVRATGRLATTSGMVERSATQPATSRETHGAISIHAVKVRSHEVAAVLVAAVVTAAPYPRQAPGGPDSLRPSLAAEGERASRSAAFSPSNRSAGSGNP